MSAELHRPGRPVDCHFGSGCLFCLELHTPGKDEERESVMCPLHAVAQGR